MCDPRRYRFWVERNHRRIGTHMVTVTGTAPALRAVVAIDLAVGFGPITVCRYRHDGDELWQVGAGRWRFTGDLTLDLDYSPEDRWSGLRFRLQGADFCYRPQTA